MSAHVHIAVEGDEDFLAELKAEASAKKIKLGRYVRQLIDQARAKTSGRLGQSAPSPFRPAKVPAKADEPRYAPVEE